MFSATSRSAILALALLATSAVPAAAKNPYPAQGQWPSMQTARSSAAPTAPLRLSDAELDTVNGGLERHSAAFWGAVALKAAEIYCGALCAAGRTR